MPRLVLSRNPGQSVRLGPDFYVTLIETRRSEVLLRCTRYPDPLGTLVRVPHFEMRELLPGVAVTYCGRNGREQVRLAFEAPQELLILRTELIARRTEK